MASKKPPKARPKKQRSAARKRPQPKMGYYGQARLSSYEEMLINSINSGTGNRKVSESAMIFTSLFSNLTPNTRNLCYKSGISAGRTLYGKFQNEKRYILYEESVSDLVLFLEKSGFERITYNVFSDRANVRFNTGKKMQLATNLHTFEAGMISGFLTAAKHQQVIINEISCAYNGFESCNFVSGSRVIDQAEGNESLEKFATNSSALLSSAKNAREEMQFPEEYSVLSSAMLVEREYQVIYNVAQEMAQSLGKKMQKPDSLARAAERAFELLDLSKLSISSVRPLKAEMRFPVLKAKKEFVDISIAFLSGFLKAAISGSSDIQSKAAMSNGSYVVRISEKKGKK
jgi:predicted hydrocarbon binding protein